MDNEGSVLADDGAARREALVTAREMTRDLMTEDDPKGTLGLSVRSEGGSILVRVEISYSIRPAS